MSPELWLAKDFDGHAIDIWAGKNCMYMVLSKSEDRCILNNFTNFPPMCIHSWNYSLIHVNWETT